MTRGLSAGRAFRAISPATDIGVSSLEDIEDAVIFAGAACLNVQWKMVLFVFLIKRNKINLCKCGGAPVLNCMLACKSSLLFASTELFRSCLFLASEDIIENFQAAVFSRPEKG